MDERIIKEYKSTFMFGTKLLILLSLFLLPPVIGFTLGGLFSSTLEKFSATYTPELEVLGIQSFPYASNKKSLGKIKATYTQNSGQEIFVLLSRKPTNEYEQNQVLNTLNSIMNDNSTQKIVGKDIFDEVSPDKDSNNYFHYKFENWGNTAVYGNSTALGGWLNGIFFFVLTIICIALYFPLVKALINLFKRKPLL